MRIKMFSFVVIKIIMLLIILNFWNVNCLGSDDSLSREEIELVAKFKPLVKDIIYKDYMNEDGYLVRFLRARNYNLDKAKEMIRDAMNWRKQNKMDTILTEDFSKVEDEYPIVFEGHDNYGRPIAFGNIAFVDIRQIVIAGRFEEFLRYFEAALELAEAVLREIHLQTGATNITRAYFFGDVSGFNLRQHVCVRCLEFIPRVMNTYENYYPDRIYKIYALNTPRIALPFFELVRPFLSPQSAAAVRLFDHNSDKWKEVLRSEVPADQLSSMYGGTRQVKFQTLSQLRKSNPFVKAAFEKAFADVEKNSNKN